MENPFPAEPSDIHDEADIREDDEGLFEDEEEDEDFDDDDDDEELDEDDDE